jgi:hypothetical protein
MDCKFLSNGIAIQYHSFVKPCCTWRADDNWIQEHSIKGVNLINWHNHKDLVDARKQLDQGIWPKNCQDCQIIESQGRQDSIRLNGNNAYSKFQSDDLTLEIRPGNVCNYACQTCWPAASSRVEAYYKKANLPNLQSNLVPNNFIDYNFLYPIADRLKSIVVLGGEPFYDPNCLEFLQWAVANTKAELLVFTNGSLIDLELLSKVDRKFTLVFSLDAIGKAAEYIRFGTVWSNVWNNYQKIQTLSNITIRINITTTPYNYFYFTDLLDLILDDWPEVVSFGSAMEEIFKESVVPMTLRPKIITKLENCVQKILKANIETNQKSNAINAIQSIIKNLKNLKYDQKLHQKFVNFVNQMDDVKNIKFLDYCTDIKELLTVKPS